MKVLVAGANGFVGPHLVAALLEDGHEVTCLARQRRDDYPCALSRARFVLADLRQPLRLDDGVDAIVHCAGTPPVRNRSAAALVADNLDSTRHLLEYALRCRPNVFVLFSTMSVYGSVSAASVNEQTAVVNPSVYGMAKLLSEEILAAHASRVPALALRLPAILGPGAWGHWLSFVLAKAGRNEPISIYNPDAPFNNAVDLQDVIGFIRSLLTQSHRGFDRITLALLGSLPIHDIVRTIVQAAGSSSPVEVRSADRPSFTIDWSTARERYGFRSSPCEEAVARYARSVAPVETHGRMAHGAPQEGITGSRVAVPTLSVLPEADRRGPTLQHVLARPTPLDRVVILGAGGFVGGVLARRLGSAGLPALLLSSADVDLTAADAAEALAAKLRPSDALVFLSAITREKGRDPATFMKNVTMGHNVARALARGCGHVVYVSSDAVYGDAAASAIDESTPCNPSCLYGMMHLARERILDDTLALTRTPLAILRPSILYGPTDTHGSYGPNRFVRTAMQTGLVNLFGRGEELRDHVYIEDMVELIVACLLRRTRGLLNIATGQSISFAEVAAYIAELAGGSVTICSQPRLIPIVDRQFDVSQTELAFPEFAYTSIRDGIARMWHALNGSARQVNDSQSSQWRRGIAVPLARNPSEPAP